MVHPALILAALSACAPLPPDRDGDGYTGAIDGPEHDCDDDDPAVSPAAAETCNGLDDDCDGTVDDGVTTAAWTDADGDGWGGEATQGCPGVAGWAADGGDCDDADPSVHPGATEICRDGIDQDCTSDDECRQTGDLVDAYGVRFSFRDYATLPSRVYGWRDLDGDGAGDVGFASWGEGAPGSVLVLMTSVVSWVPGAMTSDTEAWAVLDGHSTTRFLDAAEWPWPDAEYLALGQSDPERGLVVYDATDLRTPVTFVQPGNEIGAGYAACVANLGDVDGDGLDDLGATAATATVEGREDAGRVDIFLSGDGLPRDGAVATDIAWSIGGNAAYQGAGETVAGGDIDGDGLADVLVATSSAASGDGHGTVWVLRGSERGDSVADAWVRVQYTGSQQDYFGKTVAAADLTGDGRTDILVGAPAPYSESPGAILLAPAPFADYGTVTLDGSDAVATGEENGSRVGSRVVPLDFDGDGQADLASGASGGDRTIEERAYVRYGAVGAPYTPAWDLAMYAPSDHNYFAEDVAAVPDIDGDGTTELLVSDPGGDGAVLFLGIGQ